LGPVVVLGRGAVSYERGTPVFELVSRSSGQCTCFALLPLDAALCLLTVLDSDRYSSQFKNNYFAEMWSGSEEGSYLRLTDLCITQL